MPGNRKPPFCMLDVVRAPESEREHNAGKEKACPRCLGRLSGFRLERALRHSRRIYWFAQAMSGRYCCAAAGTARSMLWP